MKKNWDGAANGISDQDSRAGIEALEKADRIRVVNLEINSRSSLIHVSLGHLKYCQKHVFGTLYDGPLTQALVGELPTLLKTCHEQMTSAMTEQEAEIANKQAEIDGSSVETMSENARASHIRRLTNEKTSLEKAYAALRDEELSMDDREKSIKGLSDALVLALKRRADLGTAKDPGKDEVAKLKDRQRQIGERYAIYALYNEGKTAAR